MSQLFFHRFLHHYFQAVVPSPFLFAMTSESIFSCGLLYVIILTCLSCLLILLVARKKISALSPSPHYPQSLCKPCLSIVRDIQTGFNMVPAFWKSKNFSIIMCHLLIPFSIIRICFLQEISVRYITYTLRTWTGCSFPLSP